MAGNDESASTQKPELEDAENLNLLKPFERVQRTAARAMLVREKVFVENPKGEMGGGCTAIWAEERKVEGVVSVDSSFMQRQLGGVGVVVRWWVGGGGGVRVREVPIGAEVLLGIDGTALLSVCV